MRVIENHCCDCKSPSYPCLGSACPLRHEVVYYCDECGEQLYMDEIYEVDNKHLCLDCLKVKFKIDGNFDDTER